MAQRITASDGHSIAEFGERMIRRPDPVWVAHVGAPFEVETAEGVMAGHDYVAFDPQTDRVWPIDQDYLDLHYTSAEDVPAPPATWLKVPLALLNEVIEALGYVGQSTVPARSAAAQELAYQLLELRQAAQ